MSNPKIQFISSLRPSLPAGDYTLGVSQNLTVNNTSAPLNNNNASLLFSVAGERLSLHPDDVYASFPAHGSVGEHSTVLPHLILNRSTLPWERLANNAVAESTANPWLALLLLSGEERPLKLSGSSWDEVIKNNTDALSIVCQLSWGEVKKIPIFTQLKITSESSQTDQDVVTILGIKKSLLQEILPLYEELPWLTHVRQRLDEKETITSDRAVVICNRLPSPVNQSSNTLHLVSLENRYIDNTYLFDWGDPDLTNNDPFIPLVSLFSWEFVCLDPSEDFAGILSKINNTPSTVRLPDLNDASLPDEAKKRSQSGFIPLTHLLRDGSQTCSWYRGPLLPGSIPSSSTITPLLPAECADKLLVYDPTQGLFDTSYAAAWTLGRALLLQSTTIARSLYQWKREAAHHSLNQQLQAGFDHLPGSTVNSSPPSLPLLVREFFQELALLKHIPLNYLIPDERLVPLESLRFFWLDPLWIKALFDGAFSIGKVTIKDEASLEQASGVFSMASSTITGVLLRSKVVSEWKDLQVVGYPDIAESDNEDETLSNPLSILRNEVITNNLRLVLFQGEVKTLDIEKPQEALHSGFQRDPITQKLFKEPRDLQGKELETPKTIIEGNLWRSASKQVVNITELQKALLNAVGGTSSANTKSAFALQLIEGVESVRFIRNLN